MHNLSGYWRSFYADTLLRRLAEPRRFIQVVAGPRQVGKTTMARWCADLDRAESHYATADDPALRRPFWIDQEWNLGRAVAWADNLALLGGLGRF